MGAMGVSQVLSHLGARDVRPLRLAQGDVSDYRALSKLGINFSPRQIAAMAKMQYAMDDQQGGITSPSVTTPVQFLQTWLPGFIEVVTAARTIDELTGITTIGDWSDEEIVQGIKEPINNAAVYNDYTQVPLASWNTNFVQRTIVRFEQGFQIGLLEEARAARIRVSSAAEKRASAALSLEVNRNQVGFNGYNAGNNKTYGFLNDPNLPAYVTVANGASGSPLWSSKTTLEIIGDILAMASQLLTQSQRNINPIKDPTILALPLAVFSRLGLPTELGYSVQEWIDKTYKGNMTPIPVPQLDGANGGVNAAYLYPEKVNDNGSDDGSVWLQAVPAKFQTLGVEQQAKGYVEDYVNATAGVFLKRPYAVVRYSGL